MRISRWASPVLALAIAAFCSLEAAAQADSPASADSAADTHRLDAMIAGFTPREPTTVLAQAAASSVTYRIRRVPGLDSASWPEYGVPAASPVLGAYLVAAPGGKAAWSPPDPELARTLE